MMRPHSLPPPYGPGTRVLDEFVVETEVARTPVWDVYTASSDARSEPIVLRLLRRLELPAGALDALVARANALTSLAHPSLASIVGAGVHAGRLAVASVDVPGLPLRGLLATAESHRLSARDTGRVVREIAEALHYLHEQRPPVIHGAIRPAKIVLRGAERKAVLVEWGLEQIVWDAAKAAGLAHVSDPDVIACYGAPEAEELGAPVGPAADQFVLASVAYECLVGARAFAGDAQALRTIRGTQRPWIASARSDLPDELDAVLHRAWFVDPAARYPDVLSFARALEPLVSIADETGRSAPLQLESLPPPKTTVDLPESLVRVEVPVITEEVDDEVEVIEAAGDSDTPPASTPTALVDEPAAPPPIARPPTASAFASRKATLLAMQPPPALPSLPAVPPAAAAPVPPTPSVAPAPAAAPPAAAVVAPSAFASRKATLLAMQPPPPPPSPTPTVETSPPSRPLEAQPISIADVLAASSPRVETPPIAPAAAPAPTRIETPPMAPALAPSPSISSSVPTRPHPSPTAPMIAAPPREVPRREDIAAASAITANATPVKSGPSSRRWIPIALVPVAIAGAAMFFMARREPTSAVSHPPVNVPDPHPSSAVSHPPVNVPVPQPVPDPHPSSAVSHPPANVPVPQPVPDPHPSSAVPHPPVNVPVPQPVPDLHPSSAIAHAPDPHPPSATAAPSTVARPPANGPLRPEPTHQQIAFIGSSLQAGIDRCLAGHRPIGRHVFVGVAFDGPSGALTNVAVRGSAVTAAMSQCIEAHARTLSADPTSSRWVQSYHLRLP